MFPLPEQPHPYAKILDMSGNKGSQKERIIKTGNIYSVALVYINGGCMALLRRGAGEGDIFQRK